MKNFKTQSFSIATFDSLGLTIGPIFGANVAMNHLSSGSDIVPALMSGVFAGAPLGFAVAKAGPLITGIVDAMLEQKPLSTDVVNPKVYNDVIGWKAGTFAGLALGLAMTWNMNANPISAHNLLEKLPWNSSQTIKLEASAGNNVSVIQPV